jgi:hypothetical protein
MAGKKMPAFLTEKYGKKVEKYKSKSAKAKHEKGEGRKDLAMESKAEKAKAKGGKGKTRTVAQPGPARKGRTQPVGSMLRGVRPIRAAR